MFRGASILQLDAKGRVGIPGRYREELFARAEGRLVVTINHNREHCLWMYPLDEWQRVEEKLVALPSFDANHQKLKRFLLGYASDAQMDKSGRVLVPQPLREFARIDKQVCLVGQGNKFELWDERLWNERREDWLQEGGGIGAEEGISVEMEQLAL